MPYNISKHVIRRNMRYLDDMLGAQRKVSWPARHPKKLAYRIREAIHATKHHSEFEKYRELAWNYRLRVHSGWVEAEFIGVDPEERAVTAPEAMQVEEVESLYEVVGACIKLEAKTDEIHFPSVVLSHEDMTSLFEWGKSVSPKWKLISHEDKGITMTRRDVEEEFLWRPGKSM